MMMIIIINSSSVIEACPLLLVVACLPCLSTLKMEAMCSETLASLRPTRHYYREDRTLHSHRCENLKSITNSKVSTEMRASRLPILFRLFGVTSSVPPSKFKNNISNQMTISFHAHSNLLLTDRNISERWLNIGVKRDLSLGGTISWFQPAFRNNNNNNVMPINQSSMLNVGYHIVSHACRNHAMTSHVAEWYFQPLPPDNWYPSEDYVRPWQFRGVWRTKAGQCSFREPSNSIVQYSLSSYCEIPKIHRCP
jgi:hypothetical protein